MDWEYLVRLLWGMLWSVNDIILSVPTWAGAVLAAILWLSPKWEEAGKVKPVLKWLRERRTFICMSLLMVSAISVTHDMYVNKPVPALRLLATPDELTQSVLQNRDIRLADLVREDFMIRYKTFINCHIYGPAVILPKGKTTFVHPIMLVSPESGLIETSNATVSGAVVLYNCTVQDCTFHDISIIGSPQQIAKIKAGTAFPQK